ncbi:MAG: DNA mismatch repair protein MutS [Candidatus Gracilibacteria bacterium]|nr:DNA mismatch repair protein MutS [Candidatus Gracilibacteria bacterium]
MLQQYFSIKKDHPNAFLFFRLGDFYEMFGDDAIAAAKILGVTLTARGKGTENEIPMCGVPHHSSDKYISELTRHGKHVAICDQVSDPSLPGIVERQVVKVITPGTTMDETVTDTKKNHYLLALTKDKQNYGISLLDLSTGEFKLTEVKEVKVVKNLLFLIDPAELLISSYDEFTELAHDFEGRSVTEYKMPYYEDSQHVLLNHFGTATLSGFGIEKYPIGISSASTLLCYVKETQKAELDHIKQIGVYRYHDVMILDESTIRNLELLHTSRDFKKEGALLSTIDKTLTKMGARKLRTWLLSPLTNKKNIDLRLDAVSECINQQSFREELQKELSDFYDLERLVGRIGCRSANARDLKYLQVNLQKIPQFKLLLSTSQSSLLQSLNGQLDELKDLVVMISHRIHPEPSVHLTAGNIIADGWNTELDELREVLKNGNEWILNYQKNLREKTGVSTLKVKYNKVFNYYIEVSRAQAANMPEEFEVKQTLVNAQRYISSELKEFEEKFLTAEDRIKTLEKELFHDVLQEVLPYLESIQKNADHIAVLDVLQSFSQQAITYHYCKPFVSEEKGIRLKEARHPVIEMVLAKKHQSYISNDCALSEDNQIILLTGPNMAGKSSFLRQTALIVLMSHIGSFVPAESAQVGITDQIFTRVGAADDLSTGQSTFMVEMSEAANILNNATERSLIIFDELGRGTSTYDGVSIAWSILEYLSSDTKALTLFATHYHELVQVAEDIPTASNYSIAVAEKDGDLVFLRKVVNGGVDRSYGIEVAKLAGLPSSIIRRSKKILSELEKDRLQEEKTIMGNQPDLFSVPAQSVDPSPHRKIIDKIKQVNINDMTPLDALNWLAKIKKDS